MIGALFAGSDSTVFSKSTFRQTKGGGVWGERKLQNRVPSPAQSLLTVRLYRDVTFPLALAAPGDHQAGADYDDDRADGG